MSAEIAHRADVIRWAAGIFLSLLVLWLDPFGLSAHTDRLSDQILNRVAGDRLLGRESGDESPITVVLTLDSDAQLAGPGQAPSAPSPILPIAFHARLLDRILIYEPAAVFVDYRFLLDRSQERDGLGQLTEVTRRYASTGEHGTALFVVVAPRVLPPDGIRPEIADAMAALPNSPYVIADQDLRPEAAHLYALAHMLPDRGGQAPDWPSPALALYRSLCERPPTYEKAPKALVRVSAERSISENDPHLCETRTAHLANSVSAVRIIWGSSIAEPQMGWQQCRAPEHWLAVLWRSAFGGAWDVRLDCGHQPTLSAAEILSAPESWPRSPEDEPPCANLSDEKGLARWLCGRIVMIGPLSLMQPDIVLPPTSKPLPGVYWHAMALDNLLQFGNAYKRDEYEMVPGLTLSSMLLALVVLLFMAIVAIPLGLLRRQFESWIAGRGVRAHLVCDWSIYLIFVGIHFIIAFVVAWFAFTRMNLAPINWIGVFLVGMILPPLVVFISRRSRP